MKLTPRFLSGFAILFSAPELPSDGDSGFHEDFESSSGGSQRGMKFSPSHETRRASTENKKETSFHFLRHKVKLVSSNGLPTACEKKGTRDKAENFVQKTKRKLLGKSRKVNRSTTKCKNEEDEKLRLEHTGSAAADSKGIWKVPSQEMLIDFPRSTTENRHVPAAAAQNEIGADDWKNKYCPSSINTGSTNCGGDVHSFVTRPRSMLRVMYDFRAREENDVSVRRGEMVTVLNKDDQDWWWVENCKLQQGFVPKSYIWPCACYGKWFLQCAHVEILNDIGDNIGSSLDHLFTWPILTG